MRGTWGIVVRGLRQASTRRREDIVASAAGRVGMSLPLTSRWAREGSSVSQAGRVRVSFSGRGAIRGQRGRPGMSICGYVRRGWGCRPAREAEMLVRRLEDASRLWRVTMRV
jgi:hypothetical protein